MAEFNFRFDDEWYTADGAKAKFREHEKEMREEYSRMRSAAQKRLQRMKKSEFKDTKTYKEHAHGFRKLEDINPKDFHKAFKDVAGFLKSKRSSASGQREIRRKTMETLNEAIGEKKVTTKNYMRVIRVLEELRKTKQTYGSDTIVDMVNQTMALSFDQFEKILDRLPDVIENADSLKAEIEIYMVENGINSYQQIDMNEFLDKLVR